MRNGLAAFMEPRRKLSTRRGRLLKTGVEAKCLCKAGVGHFGRRTLSIVTTRTRRADSTQCFCVRVSDPRAFRGNTPQLRPHSLHKERFDEKYSKIRAYMGRQGRASSSRVAIDLFPGTAAACAAEPDAPPPPRPTDGRESAPGRILTAPLAPGSAVMENKMVDKKIAILLGLLAVGGAFWAISRLEADCRAAGYDSCAAQSKAADAKRAAEMEAHRAKRLAESYRRSEERIKIREERQNLREFCRRQLVTTMADCLARVGLD